MPKSWSIKDERQYAHVKESELELGRSTDRAEEIAARTVNKQRAAEGRTKKPRTAKKRPSAAARKRSSRPK